MDPCDVLDQYRLLERISSNDVGAVWKAVDTESGQTVVLKIPSTSAESDLVFFERFRREEALGQRLDHQNIVKVLRPRAKSREYIAMELAPGRTLRALLEPGRAWETGRALDLVRQLCEAVAYLHERGVVHRDLKPENIVVDEQGGIKIIDLGIALDRSARRITWGRLSHRVGTPDYMAPEQIAGRRGDARSDVYAIATILFELLTGHLPFVADGALAMMHAKAHEEGKRPSYFRPDIDPGLEAVLVRALHRRPADRQGSVAELIADLRDPAHALAREANGGASLSAPGPQRAVIVVGVVVLFALSSLIWLSAR